MARLVLPLVAGIALAGSLPNWQSVFLYASAGSGILCIAMVLSGKRFYGFTKSSGFGLLVAVALFFIGAFRLQQSRSIDQPDHFSHLEAPTAYLATVSEEVIAKEKSYKTVLAMRAAESNHRWHPCKGWALTYIAKDSLNPPPPLGSWVVFSQRVDPVAGPANPGVFNYKNYLANQNIYHQVYLKSSQYRPLSNKQAFDIKHLAIKLRRYLVNILAQNGLQNDEFAVAAALVLGDTGKLDPELMQTYATTGVMHILSVSGMHVGVIYIVINFLVQLMFRNRRNTWYKAIPILAVIWFYALLTGLSAAVLRAAVMFTFITLGNLSTRHVHIINSIAASLFFILLWNPLLLFNTGFQLSYMAVTGIVLINPLVMDIWQPANGALRKFWGLVSVSISAQLATMPLAALYFHQFPTYFLPANLLAVPLSSLAIYSVMAVLITSPFHGLSHLLGKLSYYLIAFLNHSMDFVSSLPHSSWPIVHIQTFETILLYAIIIIGMSYWVFRRKPFLWITLFMMLGLSVSVSLKKLNTLSQQKLAFFQTGKITSVASIQGNRMQLYCDTAGNNRNKLLRYSLSGNRSAFGVLACDTLSLDGLPMANNSLINYQNLHPGAGLWLLNGKRVAYADNLPLPSSLKPLKVDYLLLSGRYKARKPDLLQTYQPELVILNAGMSAWHSTKIMQYFAENQVATYSIKQKGALVVDTR